MKKTLRDFPRMIQVGFRNFTIRKMPKLEANRRGIWGYYCPGKNEIEIMVAERSAEDATNTLIHELLHALWDNFELEGTHEEKHVTLLANGLTEIFMNNPDLLVWIGRNLHGPR